jgi:hypothetical protein
MTERSRIGPLLRNITAIGTVVLSCALLPSVTRAQDSFENQTNTALNALYGLCLNNEFDAYRVNRLADAMGWEALDESLIEFMIPTSEINYDFYVGYQILAPGDPPLPAFAFAGLSQEDHGEVEYCSLFFGDVLVDEFVSGLQQDTHADLLTQETRYADEVTFFTVPDLPDVIVWLHRENRSDRGLRVTAIFGGLPSSN